MKITLIRHTSVYNPRAICYGNGEVQLAPSFKQEVEHILSANNFTDVSHVFSSPSVRCTLLAEECFPNHAIALQPLLSEMNFGTWQGQTWESLAAEAKEFYADFSYNKQFPNGESFMQLKLRVQTFIDFLHTQTIRHAAIITHGGTIRAFLSIIMPDIYSDAAMLPIEYGYVHTFTIKP